MFQPHSKEASSFPSVRTLSNRIREFFMMAYRARHSSVALSRFHERVAAVLDGIGLPFSI
jgi:hypothetical protein